MYSISKLALVIANFTSANGARFRELLLIIKFFHMKSLDFKAKATWATVVRSVKSAFWGVLQALFESSLTIHLSLLISLILEVRRPSCPTAEAVEAIE